MRDLIDRAVALEVAPNPEAIENGPQRHRRFETRNSVMLRWLLVVAGATALFVVDVQSLLAQPPDAAGAPARTIGP